MASPASVVNASDAGTRSEPRCGEGAGETSDFAVALMISLVAATSRAQRRSVQSTLAGRPARCSAAVAAGVFAMWRVWRDEHTYG